MLGQAWCCEALASPLTAYDHEFVLSLKCMSECWHNSCSTAQTHFLARRKSKQPKYVEKALHKHLMTPCGFAVVVYHTRQNADRRIHAHALAKGGMSCAGVWKSKSIKLIIMGLASPR